MSVNHEGRWYYTIHRYPAELIDIVQLADSRRVTVRPILPQDAELLQSFFRNLSDGSRWNRFHRALHELPLNLLNQFTNIDYDTHLALLAEVFVDGREVILGESRYVCGDDPTCAEFAITVDDRWQGKGLGRLLLGLLEGRAAAEGIEMLFGRTLPGNVRMQALARKAGFEIVPDSKEPGTLRLEKRLGLPRAHTAYQGLNVIVPSVVSSGV
jgi:GNAT superfamily N-acetyltransferase